jgi:hypothetical protein
VAGAYSPFAGVFVLMHNAGDGLRGSDHLVVMEDELRLVRGYVQLMRGRNVIVEQHTGRSVWSKCLFTYY